MRIEFFLDTEYPEGTPIITMDGPTIACPLTIGAVITLSLIANTKIWDITPVKTSKYTITNIEYYAQVQYPQQYPGTIHQLITAIVLLNPLPDTNTPPAESSIEQL
jgi:hypothetical protein